MTVKAGGRLALIIASGLWICASGPTFAAEGDTAPTDQATAVGTAVDTSAPAKATRHHGNRKTASNKAASKSRKSDRLAAKAAQPSADADGAKADDAAPAATAPQASNAMTPAVANANAQWPTDAATNAAVANTETPAANAQATAAAPVQPEQPAVADSSADATNMKVVASDQLNDLDRAATDNQPPLTLAKATIDAPAAEATSGDSNSPWDKTSMIGKIFVAFGGLLTMASAARMFMA